MAVYESTMSTRTPLAQPAIRGWPAGRRLLVEAFLSQGSPSVPAGLLIVAVLITVETAAVQMLQRLTPSEHLGALYLLGVLVAAAYSRLGVTIVAALGSAVAFDWVRATSTGHFAAVELRHLVTHSTLVVVAVCANALAGLARAHAREADQRRREADLSAELAHLTLRADDLNELLDQAARRVAAALELPGVALERGPAPTGGAGLAIPLRDDDYVLATLLLPSDVPAATVVQLRKRVVPALEAILRVAWDREAIAGALEASHRELERFFGLSSDLLCIGQRSHFLRVNPAFERVLGHSRSELVTRPLLDFVLPQDRACTAEELAAVARTGRSVRFENRLIRADGSVCSMEWNVRSHEGLFFAAGRDVTEQRSEQDRLRAAQRTIEANNAQLADLAVQQSGLRRIATLVACGVAPAEVFTAVVEEIVLYLDVAGAVLLRNEPDGQPVHVAGHGYFDDDLDDDGLDLRVPIVVHDQPWGAVAIASSRLDQLPAETQTRLEDFAELAAMAIANAAAHEELRASRARIVNAADNARRQLERDLHDGAQQRLEALKLEVRMAHEGVPDELPELRAQTERIIAQLAGVSEDLHELSRGIHPAVLAAGLPAALRTLARRSAVPVDLAVDIGGPLPESVEVAAYYVVSEALTNTAKHARAQQVSATATLDAAHLHIAVSDDGMGGADPRRGSGLVGLVDRVEALGGRLRVTSPVGVGTTLDVDLPVNPPCPRTGNGG